MTMLRSSVAGESAIGFIYECYHFMRKLGMQKLLWFSGGLVLGLTALSITRASVPSKSHVTDDTSIYQNLSEIRVPKQGKIDFDYEIAQLSEKESRYQEKLPLIQHNKLKAAVQRVSQEKYRYVGKAKKR